MLSTFFSGFDIPSLFDSKGMTKRRKKFEKFFTKQSNFLNSWNDDFDLFTEPLRTEPKLATLKRKK